MEQQFPAENIRVALYRVVAQVDPSAKPEDSFDVLRQRYKDLMSKLGRKSLSAQIGLTVAEIDRYLDPRLKKVAEISSAPAAVNPAVRYIAELRLLVTLGIVLSQKGQASPTIPSARGTETVAQKQIRAIELVLRGLVDEKYGDQEVLVRRLSDLFDNPTFKAWLSHAEAGNVLSGATFYQLVSVFTNEADWQHYDPIYYQAETLTYLREKRVTIRDFLEDIAFMRNKVAHHRPLTPIDIELLNLYYNELIEPVQSFFRDGRTKVDPAAIFNVGGDELQAYLTKLGADIALLDERTRQMAEGLGQIDSAVQRASREGRSTNRKMRVLLGLSAIAVSAILFAVYYAHRVVVHDYHSIGWITVSGTETNPNSPIKAEAIVWMGDDHQSFGQTRLRALANSANSALLLDLTPRLDADEIGSQQTVAFALPARTDHLVTCLSVPSKALGARYRVTQRFKLTTDGGNLRFVPVSGKLVNREDDSTCGSIWPAKARLLSSLLRRGARAWSATTWTLLPTLRFDFRTTLNGAQGCSQTSIGVTSRAASAAPAA